MAALPKRKISKQRRNKRRSHDALVAPSMSKCPECGHLAVRHQVCMNCGMYNGVQVVKVK